MKETLKITLFELKKIFYNKKLLWYLVFAFYIFIMLLIVVRFSIYLHATATNNSYTLETLISNRDNAKYYYDIACGIKDFPPGSVGIPNMESLKDNYLQEYLYYEYLIKVFPEIPTFLDLKYPMSSFKGLEGGVFILQMGKYFFFIMGLLSIVISLNVCFADTTNNRLKNIKQSNIAENKIIIGKMLASFIIITFLTFIGAITILLVSLDKGSMVLVYSKVEATAISIQYYFWVKVILSYVYCLLIAIFTILLRFKIKNSYVVSLISILIIGFFFGLGIIISKHVNSPLGSDWTQSYVPFANLLVNNMLFKDLAFILAISICFLIFIFIFSFLIIYTRMKNK